MKKFLYILLAAAAIVPAVSCDREDAVEEYDALGGYRHSENVLKEYMLGLADELVTTSLDELEQALAVDTQTGIARYFYDTDGKELTASGSVWTVLREDRYYGMTITCLADGTAWRLNYTGPLSLNGYLYDTEFVLTATVADPAESGHRGWMVTLDGTRTESEGFSCCFCTDGSMEYRALETMDLWGAYGYLLMDVKEDGVRIDRIILEIRGGKSSASVLRVR